MNSKKLLTTKEAATLLGVSRAFLERDRWRGATIPFVRIGTRTVRYHPDVIQNIMGSQTLGLTKKVDSNFSLSTLSVNR